MKHSLLIRSLYQPLQPAEDYSAKSRLYYKEHAPSPLLQPYIHCFWELHTKDQIIDNYIYRVVADGCVDLIMDSHTFNGMWIAGISDSAFDVPVNGKASYFGMRFLPGYINHFFRFPVHSIANQMPGIEDVLDKRTSDLSCLLFEAKTISDKIRVAESCLLKKIIKEDTMLHPGLARAIYHILSGNGDISIQDKAAEWISPRQLQRLFQEHIGCSPKLFSRIVRFQKTLLALQQAAPENKQSLFYDYGYFDQPHFIKEFKTFYGQTPSMILKK